jgi:hypothetical protein
MSRGPQAVDTSGERWAWVGRFRYRPVPQAVRGGVAPAALASPGYNPHRQLPPKTDAGLE